MRKMLGETWFLFIMSNICPRLWAYSRKYHFYKLLFTCSVKHEVNYILFFK